jgi:hypothetical protein
VKYGFPFSELSGVAKRESYHYFDVISVGSQFLFHRVIR